MNVHTTSGSTPYDLANVESITFNLADPDPVYTGDYINVIDWDTRTRDDANDFWISEESQYGGYASTFTETVADSEILITSTNLSGSNHRREVQQYWHLDWSHATYQQHPKWNGDGFGSDCIEHACRIRAKFESDSEIHAQTTSTDYLAFYQVGNSYSSPSWSLQIKPSGANWKIVLQTNNVTPGSQTNYDLIDPYTLGDWIDLVLHYLWDEEGAGGIGFYTVYDHASWTVLFNAADNVAGWDNNTEVDHEEHAWPPFQKFGIYSYDPDDGVKIIKITYDIDKMVWTAGENCEYGAKNKGSHGGTPLGPDQTTHVSSAPVPASAQYQLDIYPNPYRGSGPVSFSASKGSVKFYNVSGKEVASFGLEKGGNHSLGALAAGVYFAEWKKGGKILSRRSFMVIN
jgi:hypothetical protein